MVLDSVTSTPRTVVNAVVGLRGYVCACACVRACVLARACVGVRARACLFWATCWFRWHDVHLHVHQGEICRARSRRGVETSSRAVRVAGIAESTYVGPQQADTRARTAVAPRRGKVVHHRTYFRWWVRRNSLLTTRFWNTGSSRNHIVSICTVGG